jgi:hypothetical protein
MLMKNLAHHSVIRGYTVCFTTASAMLEAIRALSGRVGPLHGQLTQCDDPIPGFCVPPTIHQSFPWV